MKRLVLLGGGHAHVHVLRDYALRPDESTSVSLVTPYPTLPYTGMLPGCIAGHYTPPEVTLDLLGLAGHAHAAFVQTTGVLVNPSMREVVCADGSVLPYDVLSINIGSRSAFAGVKGAERHSLGIRPLEQAFAGLQRILDGAARGEIQSVTVVGGGAGGVELAFALDWRMRGVHAGPAPHVRILADTPAILPGFPQSARRIVTRRMQERNIGIHAGSAVTEVGPDFVRVASGLEFASQATVWVAGAGAPELFRDSGFATDARGFLAVNDCLQSQSHPGVFGAGDCVTNESQPRPKAGVFAVRAGPPLARNLRSALSGAPLVRWPVQRNYLALLSTGERNAVGVWGPFAWHGKWVWRWKDRIDRRFVKLYSNQPEEE